MACAVMLALPLTGCVGPERGLNGTVDDITIGTQVSLALLSGYGSPTVNVYQGRVLLTGTVPDPAAKAAATDAARRVTGVRMIYNEMVVAPPSEINSAASDTWISTQVRSQMLLAVDVQSSNYLATTDHGVVYLIGTAASRAELDRTVQIARYVPGVQRVVSYVDVRAAAPAMAAPGPAPYAAPAAPPRAAPSGAPIQVQRL
jgi:osmotically-inducible protein OsmY